MPVATPRVFTPIGVIRSGRISVRLLPQRWLAYRDQCAQVNTEGQYGNSLHQDAYAQMLEWCLNQWGEKRFFQPWSLSTRGLLRTTSARMLIEFKMRWHGATIDRG